MGVGEKEIDRVTEWMSSMSSSLKKQLILLFLYLNFLNFSLLKEQREVENGKVLRSHPSLTTPYLRLPSVTYLPFAFVGKFFNKRFSVNKKGFVCQHLPRVQNLTLLDLDLGPDGKPSVPINLRSSELTV